MLCQKSALYDNNFSTYNFTKYAFQYTAQIIINFLQYARNSCFLVIDKVLLK